LPNYGGKVRYAQLLNDYSEIQFVQADNKEDIILTLPKVKPPYEVTVIEFLLK